MLIILAVSDILAAFILVLRAFQVELPATALFVAGLYLLAKLFIFPLNIAGFIDFVAGILILLSFFLILPKALALILAALVLWKAARTFSA